MGVYMPQIWEHVLRKHPKTELTEKQIYAYWAQMNTGVWRLKEDQIESALAILAKVDGVNIDIIPVPAEDGISALAFAFRDALKLYGEQIIEVAMDSTCQAYLDSCISQVLMILSSGKTNALGYELYGIVGEANGQALPLAFAFTASIAGDAAPGTKDRMLQHVISHVHQHCPNIAFTLSDKDVSEINAFRAKIPDAKHQLCYWHAIKYLEERLADDKPPARYDPRTAHQLFPFVDPTWAPGVTAEQSKNSASEVLSNNTNVSENRD
jgi:MULE transposase domain